MLIPNRCIAVSLSLDFPLFKKWPQRLRDLLLWRIQPFFHQPWLGKILLELLQNH